MLPVRVVIANSVEAFPYLPPVPPNRQVQNLTTVHATAEIRESVPRLRAQLAIVDLEVVTFAELADLCREFPSTAFVCIHRLADDAMWMKSLAAGAVDCCVSSDLARILENADRYVAINEQSSAA